MRLLLDEHFSPRRIGGRLTAAGHDVLAIAEIPAYAGLPDEQVLELAADERRVLVTRNAKDFDWITRRWATHLDARDGRVRLIGGRDARDAGEDR